MTALINVLRQKKKKLGLASICLGGGGGMSMVVKAL